MKELSLSLVGQLHDNRLKIAAKDAGIEEESEDLSENSNREFFEQMTKPAIQAPSSIYANNDKLKIKFKEALLCDDTMDFFDLSQHDIREFEQKKFSSDINFRALNIQNVRKHLNRSKQSPAVMGATVKQFCDKIHKKELQAKIAELNKKSIQDETRQAKLKNMKYWDDFRARR